MAVMDRVAELLDLLATEGRPLKLSEISLGMDLPKSSVHRLCSDLSELRIIHRDAMGCFTIGPRLISWGAAAERIFDLRSVAEEIMAELRDATGETVNLHVPDGAYRMCVTSLHGLFSLVPIMPPGRRLPLGLGATGRVLMAHATPENVARARVLLSETGRPVTTDLELRRIRETNWVAVSDEQEMGLSAAATPVRSVTGRVVAALSVGGATARLTSARMADLRPQVVKTAEDLGAALGDALERMYPVERVFH